MTFTHEERARAFIAGLLFGMGLGVALIVIVVKLGWGSL